MATDVVICVVDFITMKIPKMLRSKVRLSLIMCHLSHMSLCEIDQTICLINTTVSTRSTSLQRTLGVSERRKASPSFTSLSTDLFKYCQKTVLNNFRRVKWTFYLKCSLRQKKLHKLKRIYCHKLKSLQPKSIDADILVEYNAPFHYTSLLCLLEKILLKFIRLKLIEIYFCCICVVFN